MNVERVDLESNASLKLALTMASLRLATKKTLEKKKPLLLHQCNHLRKKEKERKKRMINESEVKQRSWEPYLIPLTFGGGNRVRNLVRKWRSGV